MHVDGIGIPLWLLTICIVAGFSARDGQPGPAFKYIHKLTINDRIIQSVNLFFLGPVEKGDVTNQLNGSISFLGNGVTKVTSWLMSKA